MEYIVIGLFCLVLMGCVFTNTSTIIALLIGYIIFFSYGLLKKCSVENMLKKSFQSFLKVKTILITFILIGSMTALWRASGTIASFVYYSSHFIQPSIFLLFTFLSNCLVSFMTGTSVGTASTMGVICMSIGLSMNYPILWIGGAILGGAFFGDRCSPVSTSALLVSTLTKTDLYTNIKYMFKSAIVPFILTCIIYGVAGVMINHGSYSLELFTLFQKEYVIHYICLLPAISILVLALFKVNVKWNLLCSIIISIPICIFVQNKSISNIMYMLLNGYSSTQVELASMINGGGIQSMVKVGVIISIASSYSGLFEVTHLLDHFKTFIINLSKKINHFLVVIIVSTISAMVGCNQTLAIMLTQELCNELFTQQQLAIAIENSAIVIAGMIPWSVACITPLAAIQVGIGCIPYAFYLYLIPICYLFTYKRTVK